MVFGGGSMDLDMSIAAHVDDAMESIRGLGESLLRISEYVIGYDIAEGAIDGIKELTHGLIEANAIAEQLTQTFTGIYQSSAEGKQAVDWITQFAMNAPFTRTSIMQAGVAVASFGGNITEVLPALGNLAAVMGTDMPTAAQALEDAWAGRFQMMQRDLHVTKEELVQFGLQVDGTGHVVQSSLIPAFEKFVAARYPNGMALQMQTFNGQMSNLEDHFQNIERVTGKGIFTQVKGDLFDLITYLNSHQADVNNFATAIGTVLGGAAETAGTAIRGFLSDLPTIINAMSFGWSVLSGAVDTAATVIEGAMGTVGNFLQQTVEPAFYQVLGNVLLWWQQHGANVKKVLLDLWTNIQGFAGTVGGVLSGFYTIIKDVAKFTWGAIEVITGTALQNIDGNTRQWQAMQVDGWVNMETSIIGIVGGIVKAVMDLGYNSAIPDALAGLLKMAVNIIVGTVNLIPTGIALALNAAEALLNQFLARFSNLSISTGPFTPPIHITGNMPQFHEDFAKDAAAQNQRAMDTIDQLFSTPAHSAADQRMTAATVAANNAKLDTLTQAAQDAVMEANGYVKQAVGLKNSASGDQPGTVMWVKAGTDTTAQAFHYSDAQAQVAGQGAIDKAMTAWQAILDKKFKLTDSGAGGLGPMPGAGGLPVNGMGDMTDAAAAKAAADRVLKDARDQFDIDRNNGATQATLLGDIKAILKDMTPALGFDAKDRAVENNRLMKEITAATTAVSKITIPRAALSGGRLLNAEAGYNSDQFAFGSTKDSASAVITALQQQLAGKTEEITLLRQLVTLLGGANELAKRGLAPSAYNPVRSRAVGGAF